MLKILGSYAPAIEWFTNLDEKKPLPINEVRYFHALFWFGMIYFNVA